MLAESDAYTVAEDETKPDGIGSAADRIPRQHADNAERRVGSQVGVTEPKRRETVAAFDFVMLAATVVTGVSGLLVARFTTLSTWTIVLVALGVILALAVAFTRLTETRWFYLAVAWTVIIALLASGVYIAAKGKQAQGNPIAQNPTSSLPAIRFAPAKIRDVCQVYSGTGTIPRGDDLLIFTSPAGGSYYFEGMAANQGNGTWRSPLVMAGNDPTVISAVLVPEATEKLLRAISIYSDRNTVEAQINSGQLGLVWLLTSLPDSTESIPPLVVHPPKGHSGCPAGY